MGLKRILIMFQEYVKTDPSGRVVDNTDMLVVKQCHEPVMFTGQFELWDADKFTVNAL